MPSTHSETNGSRRPRSRSRVILSLLAALLIAPIGLSFLYSATIASAADGEQSGDKTGTEAVRLPQSVIPIPVKLTEEAAKPGVAKQIDGVFAKAVEHTATVLFYRLFSGTEDTVTTVDESFFVRPKGSKDAFEEIDLAGKKTGKKMTQQQADALLARGMLVTISGDRVWREGSMGDEAVEFVTVTNDASATYVRDDSDGNVVYRRKLAKRDLLGTESADVLTEKQVAALAEQGKLKADASKLDANGNLKAGATDPYLATNKSGGAPLVVIWLACGSIFFTIYMRGFNIWGFKHALEVVWGRYDNPDEPGEVTHFQALSSALSATVGLGNIAGVTLAMTFGGPGAFFWMMACGFFGMTSKFVECTLGQKFRTVKPDGTILGGPMQYLSAGLKELGLGGLGSILGVVFAVLCIFASFGGGNMFQANQAGATILYVLQKSDTDELETIEAGIKDAAAGEDFAKMEELQARRETVQTEMDGFKQVFGVVFGVVLAGLVGLVIIGGIKRIGAAAEKIVPTMCGMYILACLYVIFTNFGDVPSLFGSIFTEAFTGKAFGGGVLGVLVIGVQRAAFSNEAGIGSAAIAHSAAKTEEPVREGCVALLGPFIDTIVICSMTALVILITGAWNNDAWLGQGLAGASLASRAFAEELSWFPWVLAVAIVLFAYSTIVSWSYYGERCWERLFGARTTIVYKVLFITAVFIGTIINLGAVLDFSDLMILSMAFPNVLGAVLLAPGVKRDLADYWRRYKAGEFKTFK